MKKKLLITVVLVAILSGSFLLGTYFSKMKKESLNNVNASDDLSVDADDVVVDDNSEADVLPEVEEDGTAENISDDSNETDITTENEYSSDVVSLKVDNRFIFKGTVETDEPSFATPWKSSPDGSKEICIDGRGFEAIEEGEGVIYVKDTTSGTMKKYVISGENSLAPSYVEWFNNGSILVTMVNKYGRDFTGSTVYKVNLDEFVPYVVYSAADNEEIVEASKISSDIINIKIRQYNGSSTKAIEKEIVFK